MGKSRAIVLWIWWKTVFPVAKRLGGCGFRRRVLSGSCNASADMGSLEASPQGRPRRSKLDAVSDSRRAWRRSLTLTMPELADDLLRQRGMRATPAMLSRHLIHRLGYTYKKIADRDGAVAQKGARRAHRVAAAPDAEDASGAAQAGVSGSKPPLQRK